MNPLVPEDAVLQVDGLGVSFNTEAGRIEVITDVSFHLRRGTTLGIVGESGCGKSVTALALMRLLPKPSGRIEGGSILLRGQELTTASLSDMRRVRGRHMAMVFQEPMTALNPVKRIGQQLAEVFKLHFPELSAGTVFERCLDMLSRVGIPEPRRRLSDYPHQLSGGMRQRVMIAMALACEPDVLIADEPTTALDVTIQAQILELMKDLQRQQGMAIIFITHDLGVIAEMCDHVVVMYGGVVVEDAPVGELFKNPAHPYTRGLLASVPRLTHARHERLPTIEGSVPALGQMPSGCRFQNRCQLVEDSCRVREPELRRHSERRVRCIRAGEQRRD